MNGHDSGVNFLCSFFAERGVIARAKPPSRVAPMWGRGFMRPKLWFVLTVSSFGLQIGSTGPGRAVSLNNDVAIDRAAAPV